MSSKRSMQEVKCTIHDLTFTYDANRCRALNFQGAFVSCPICSHEKLTALRDRLEAAETHLKSLVTAMATVNTLTFMDNSNEPL